MADSTIMNFKVEPNIKIEEQMKKQTMIENKLANLEAELHEILSSPKEDSHHNNPEVLLTKMRIDQPQTINLANES